MTNLGKDYSQFKQYIARVLKRGIPVIRQGDKRVLNNSGGLKETYYSLGKGYNVVDSTHDTIVEGMVRVSTDGTTQGRIDLIVNIDDNDTNYWRKRIRVSPESGAGALNETGYSVVVPAGSSFRMVNRDDPTNNNAEYYQRVWNPGN